MKKLIGQIICDVDGQGSSKRITLFVILLLMVAITIGVTFCKSNYPAAIWPDLKYTLWLCLGFVFGEKLTSRTADQSKPNE